MRRSAVALLAAFLIFSATNPALARWSSGSSGGGGRHSSGKHVPAGTYIEKTCKTEACFKKHPSGHYGFVTGQRKRKE